MKKSFFLLFCLTIVNFCFSQEFTLAVIPDTQNYVYYHCQSENGYPFSQREILFKQMNYLKENSYQNGGKIRFAVHLGDLVESQFRVNKSPEGEYIILPESVGKEVLIENEWKTEDEALSILDGNLPYLVVPGNHDCDRWIRDKTNPKSIKMDGYETFIKYFGPESKHFKNQGYYGGAYNGVNSWGTFTVDDKNFLVIGLEIEASDEVLEWAENVVKAHPNYAVIVFIHEYMSCNYDIYNPGFANRISTSSLVMTEKRNSPEQIWEKFISKNRQIFLLLCGHAFIGDIGEGARVDIDDDGYKVYQLLSNYQGRCRTFDLRKAQGKKCGCGDGWLRLMEFNLNKNQVTVKTYSIEMDKYEKDPDSNFTIRFDWKWEERFGKRNDK